MERRGAFDKNGLDQRWASRLMVNNIQSLRCVDCHLGDSGTPKGFDFRSILDLELMAKKWRLHPRSVYADQVHANHDTRKGNVPFGHGSDPHEK